MLREIWRDRIWGAIPARVVEDAEDRRLFHVAARTTFKSPRSGEGAWLRLPTADWTLADRAWSSARPILSFALDGLGSAFLLFWDGAWRPLHWYVNLQTPLRRTRLGFDYTDHVLDLLVSLDGSSVAWKDEEELEAAVGLGLYSAEDAAAFRAEGARSAERLVGGEPPFDHDWTTWRPDPAWSIPELPAGWDRLSPSNTDRP